MSNTITIELCEEDRKRLDSVTCLLGHLIGEQKQYNTFLQNAFRTPAAPQEAPEQPAPEINHPADILPPHGEPEPAADSEPVIEPELPKYTTADILAKVQTMAGPGNPKREKAKAIVTSYGKKVSDIPEDKRTEAMMRLIALETEAEG